MPHSPHVPRANEYASHQRANCYRRYEHSIPQNSEGASSLGIGYQMEGGAGWRGASEVTEGKLGYEGGISHQNFHSLDKIQQRQLLLHICIL
ncbi:hypothetical protein EVAR_2997_1 [Eumeta japonica]|uniref:Uncharacterized protein n=1 Tax=Eumeta variegata TaxID=151549 RepID=A0A4C1SWS0_EUMVA|nr:hypothetical protein EVAR_2997_1 [Eumeta japonica]